MFEVAYETTFCSTHRLTKNGQPLEPLHGHDWQVEVVAARETLDDKGVVLDFEDLKTAVGQVAGRFHYQDMGAHPDFAGKSASAEEVARYFFVEVRKLLGEAGRQLVRVRVFEAPGCSAAYFE